MDGWHKVLVTLIVVAAITITNLVAINMHYDNEKRNMIATSQDPIAAYCAISGSSRYSTDEMCLLRQVEKLLKASKNESK